MRVHGSSAAPPRATVRLVRPEEQGDWRGQGACADADAELFFPVGVDGPLAVAQAQEAVAVCAGCPVVGRCLTWAREHDVRWGVWGGVWLEAENPPKHPRGTKKPRASGSSDPTLTSAGRRRARSGGVR